MAQERLCDRLQIKSYPSYVAFERNQLYRYTNASHTDLLYNFALAEDYKLVPPEEVPRTLSKPGQVLLTKILNYYRSLLGMSLDFFPLGTGLFLAICLFAVIASGCLLLDVARLLRGLLRPRKPKLPAAPNPLPGTAQPAPASGPPGPNPPAQPAPPAKQPKEGARASRQKRR